MLYFTESKVHTLKGLSTSFNSKHYLRLMMREKEGEGEGESERQRERGAERERVVMTLCPYCSLHDVSRCLAPF